MQNFLIDETSNEAFEVDFDSDFLFFLFFEQRFLQNERRFGLSSRIHPKRTVGISI